MLADKNPTPTDTCREAKSTIPLHETLERRVMSVIHSLMEKDLEVDHQRASGVAITKEPRSFTGGVDTWNAIVNQMSHVKKGCLLDPPWNVVVGRYGYQVWCQLDTRWCQFDPFDPSRAESNCHLF